MLGFSFLSRICIALLLVLMQPVLLWAASDQSESTAKQTAMIQTSANDISEPTQQLVRSAIQQVNINTLKQRLRKTAAIGFFTKLAIRNDLVDLMDEIKRYRKKSILNDKLNEIRASFDGLLLKLIALLDKDPDLSRDLYVGRELIWQSLFEEKA